MSEQDQQERNEKNCDACGGTGVVYYGEQSFGWHEKRCHDCATIECEPEEFVDFEECQE